MYTHHQNSKSIHAEVDALKYYYPKQKDLRKGICLVSLRFSRDGTLRNAKPCRNCVKFMKTITKKRGYNINYVIYSTEEGFVKISLRDLILSVDDCYVSSGSKK